MNHFRYGKAVLLLAGVMTFSGAGMRVEASGSLSSLLPAAGMALTMDEGSSSSSKPKESKSTDTGSKDAKGTDTKSKDAKDSKGQKAAPTSSGNTVASSDTVISSGKSEGVERKEQSILGDVLGSIMQEASEETERIISEETSQEASGERGTQEAAPAAPQSPDEKGADGLTAEERSFSNLVIAKVTNYVNIRSIPGEDGEVVGKLYDKSVGEFIEESNGWYKIKSGSVTGYVKGEFCVTGEAAIELAKQVGTRVAVVNTTTLKVRNEPGTESAVLGLVPIEEELTVVEELEEWVKVDIEEGYGYVSREFVNLHTEFVKAESVAEEKARLAKEEKARKEAQEATRRAQAQQKKESEKKKESTSSKSEAPAPVTSAAGTSMGQQVVNYAMQFVGNPYVYGGTSLTNGADCSGFVMSVYKNFGVSLPHSSSADRKQGYDVGGLANAQPGDLVCYSGHVGIYAGGGKIVHASTAKTGITVSNANYRQVLAVRRIFT